MEVSRPLNAPIEIDLSDFEQFLTRQRGFTTEQARAICRDAEHESYLTLWAEFEAACKLECEGSNG